MDLTDHTVHQALDGMGAGDFTSEELTRAYLDRIERFDSGLIQAYVTVTAELALDQARDADRRRRRGDQALLLGVPMALKDLVLTDGIRTTCGSKISSISSPSRTRRSPPSSTTPAPCCSARRTWTSSPWAHRRRTRPVPHREPMGRPDAGAGRVQRWLGRRDGRPAGRLHHRFRHRRVDPPAGGALRGRPDSSQPMDG